MKKTLFIIVLFVNVFFANANTRVSGYRWRNDDGDQTAASWKTPAANAPIQITDFTPVRLRIAVEEYANSGFTVMVNVNPILEYSENGGPWQNIEAPGSKFAFVSSAYVPDDTPTTQQVSSGTFAGGKFKSSGNNTTFTMQTYKVCEHEFCIKPLETIATSSTYSFRIPYLNGPDVVVPLLTTAAVLCATPTAYNVTGGGNGCQSLGLEVALDGSQAGMNYQLKLDGTPIGNEVAGTGGILSFGLQTVSGNYTVEALNNTNGCNITAAMNGSATLDLDPSSVGGDVTGGSVICSNTEGGALILSGNLGTVVNWESAVSPFTVWTPVVNTTADYNPGVLTETTKFRAVSKNGSCDPVASTETTVIVITPTAAPTGTSLQVYAGDTATLADVAVDGFGIKWYTAASNGTELTTDTALTDGETYYASQTFNGCESSYRLAVTVRKISEVSQSFCDGAIVDDLVTTPSPGQTVQWFYDAEGTSPVATGTTLYNGTYFAAQRIPSVVTTFAGSGTPGTANGTGTAAQFFRPRDLVIDSQGNLFVTDYSARQIRKITPAGVVTTFAGGSGIYADGTGMAATFNQPHGIAIDGSDNLYIADSGNSRIRKITPAAVVTTIAGQSAQGTADGNGTNAQFTNPAGVTVDAAGNIYVADTSNHRIRKITPAGDVTTLAGSTDGYNDAQGTGAQFSFPYDTAIDSFGNVYVADINNNKIRKITPAGEVTTFAGSTPGDLDGEGTAAMFNSPRGITIDASNNLYVVDTNSRKIRKITPSGTVSTVAGSGISGTADGNGDIAEFAISWGIAIDAAGVIYVADTNNSKIRKIIQGSPYSNLVPVSVVINPMPVLDAQENVTACGSYTLPGLSSGNYFTASNGGGTALYNGDVIAASQTIYVYAESGTTPNCTVQNSFDVTIIPSPVAEAQANVTACGSYTLPALTSGNYFTEANGGGTALFDGNVITATQTLYVYADSGTTPNCTDEHAFEVTINPFPVAAITQSGDTLTVSETGAAYQWFTCQANGMFIPIAGATDQAYLATATGSYAVEVIKNGCPALSNCFEIAALGNPDFDFNTKIKVYPNPSSTMFYITSDSHATIAVFDLIGKTIRTQEINQGTSPLDLSLFPSGIYLMKVTNDSHQVKTIKLVKE